MNASKNRRGFALVFALFLVVLVAATLVGFLLSVTTERSAAGGFAAAGDARQFSDTAVGLVQAQINQATTRGSTVAWVSQPGMVRTFDSTGNLQNAYKLYSAANMIDTTVDLTTDLPPANWNTQTAQWVDLNAPATANGVKTFPILDPAALKPIGSIGGLGPTTGQDQFGGLAITNAPGATTYQPVPMPVQWLYMLKDGTVAAPTGGNGKTAAVGKETPDNPIVGRIAFWTDDDSCKVNLNTAGEDTFWDVPHGMTKTETLGGSSVTPGGGFAVSQPAHGEYQRYPGHPATVSLSAVLPGLTSQPYTLQNYMNLTPRYQYGGSKGGTVSLAAGTGGAQAITPKGDRLYTTVDELLFQPTLTANARNNNTGMSEALVESRRFFLTPHSRAPETNLYNLPRIAMWPIYKLTSGTTLDQNRTNSFDRTIVLCSSTGTVNSSSIAPYFFQREQPLIPGNDLGDPYATPPDPVTIPRNLNLYSYLQYLTGTAGTGIPGFGGDFKTKYSVDRDQILTEMFDYIRCSNLYDDTLAANNQFTASWTGYKSSNPGYGFAAPIHGPHGTQGQGRWQTLRQMDIMIIACADGDQPAAAKYFSNDPKFNRTLFDSPNIPSGNAPFDPSKGKALLPGQLRIQLLVFPEFYSTMEGWRSLHQDMRIEIDGLDKFVVNDTVKPQFPASAGLDQTDTPLAIGGGAMYGGSQVYNAVFYNKRTYSSSFPITTDTATMYPFVSVPVTIPKGGTVYLKGGNITVRLYAGDKAAGTQKLVQTFVMNIPSGDFPQPSLAANPHWWTFYSDGIGVGTTLPATVPETTPDATSFGRLTGDYSGKTHTVSNVIISPDTGRDTLRAVVLKHGDYRLITSSPMIGTATVPTDLFVRHGWYADSTKAQARLGADGGARLMPGGSGELVVGSNNGDFPIGTSTGTAVVTPIPSAPIYQTGDFDTGTANTSDGASVNKADDGDFTRNFVPDAGHLKDSQNYSVPYYSNPDTDTVNGQTFFSPNRSIPSALMFGSLPTGVKAGTPWQTLLFRPLSTRESNPPGHPGANAPKDSLLADLFWMPMVEPYAMSDRFSTAGKVNMNYQILPFTYVERSTGLRAVLKNEMVTALANNNTAVHYSSYTAAANGVPAGEFRIPIDVDETLKQFTARFGQTDSKKNVFISPSELCSLYMVPKGLGLTAAGMPAYWDLNRQTGDNLRERIYATTYPKLTTKSNTYTVHYRAQSLKKAPGSVTGTWTEGRDAVLGEYRGSTTLERFISPDAMIPDYALAAQAGNLSSLATLDTFYKWRVLESQQFTP